MEVEAGRCLRRGERRVTKQPDLALRVRQLEQQLGQLERENARLNAMISSLRLQLATADAILRDIALNGRDHSANAARGWILQARKPLQ